MRDVDEFMSNKAKITTRRPNKTKTKTLTKMKICRKKMNSSERILNFCRIGVRHAPVLGKELNLYIVPPVNVNPAVRRPLAVREASNAHQRTYGKVSQDHVHFALTLFRCGLEWLPADLQRGDTNSVVVGSLVIDR